MQIKKYLLEQGVSTIQDAYKYYEYFKSQGYSSNEESYKRYCRMLFKGKIKNVVPDKTIETSRVEDIQKGLIESTINTDKKVKDGPAGLDNAEDMAKYCNIDLDKWEATKIVSNIWGPQDDPYWQFKVFWALKYKKGEISPKSAAKEFEDLIKNIKIPKPNYKKAVSKKSGKTVVLGLTDAHLNAKVNLENVCYNGQTGRWTLDRACDALLDVIDYYCDYYKNENIDKFIVPVGSDLFNSNNERTTTLNGTPQMDDQPNTVAFRKIMETIIIATEKILKVSKKIDLVYLPGNHDKHMSCFLTTGLYFVYKDRKEVNVDITLHERKYIKVGNTLVVLVHGHVSGKTLKIADLPEIVAAEAPELWGKCKYVEIFIGHVHHHETIVSKNNGKCTTHILPMIAPPTIWVHSSAFLAERKMEVSEIDQVDGLIKTVVCRA